MDLDFLQNITLYPEQDSKWPIIKLGIGLGVAVIAIAATAYCFYKQNYFVL